MHRREFVKKTGYYAVTLLASPTLVSWVFEEYARAGDFSATALEGLRAALVDGGELLVPTDGDFAETSQVYQARYNKVKPQLIVRPVSAQEVSNCLVWAQEQVPAVPIHVKGGGNSFEGLSTGPGLVIDLKQMARIEPDKATQTAVIGAGALLGDVYRELYKSKLVLPAGSCPQVCISGLTLGGGHGLLSRKWGLTTDHLLGAEVVTAEGTIRQVSATQEPELFWGLRGGGGGNFGVVTQFKFKVRPVLPVTLFKYRWPVEQAWKVFSAWQDFAPYAKDELATIFILSSRDQELSRVGMMGQFVGSVAELKKVLAPFLGKAPIESLEDETIISPSSYLEAVDYFADGKIDGVFTTSFTPTHFKASSDYVFQEKKITQKGLNELVEGLRAYPLASTALFDAYGGQMDRTPTGSTAFAHRVGALYSIQYYGSANSEKQVEERRDWMKALRKRVAPYVAGHGYINYADLDVPDFARAYHGTNLPRLQRLKAAVDPKNVFSHGLSLHGDPNATYLLDQVYPMTDSFSDKVSVRFKLVGKKLIARFEVKSPSPYVKAGAPLLDKPTEDLFNFECVELFLSVNGMPAGDLSGTNKEVNDLGTRDEIFPYHEFEVSPRKEYLEVQVLSPKKAQGAKRFVINKGARICTPYAGPKDGYWAAEIHVPLDKLGWKGDPSTIVGNAFAIIGPKEQQTYWSLFLPRQQRKADGAAVSTFGFHKPRYFERLL